MKIIFTICSNNYLALAKTLGDSALQHNPDYKFIIGIVDKKSNQVNYSDYKNFTLIFVEELQIPEFSQMVNKYNIVELNTSVKPFYFLFLFQKFNSPFITYLDPDTMVFNHFKDLETYQKQYEIILTPHILSPIKPDNKIPQENTFLKFGIYNLGFLSVKNSPVGKKYLSWWSERLKTKCLNLPQKGLFVDQLPNNLTPIFFENVGIFRHPGYNMAYWNLHERFLKQQNQSTIVNEKYPLCFFHFSQYPIDQYKKISKTNTNYLFADRPDLLEIHQIYSNNVLKNNYHNLKKIQLSYIAQKEKAKQAPPRQPSLLKKIFIRIVNKLN